jgi:hypothetical protein
MSTTFHHSGMPVTSRCPEELMHSRLFTHHFLHIPFHGLSTYDFLFPLVTPTKFMYGFFVPRKYAVS